MPIDKKRKKSKYICKFNILEPPSGSKGGQGACLGGVQGRRPRPNAPGGKGVPLILV